jgi:hypothetical protein
LMIAAMLLLFSSAHSIRIILALYMIVISMLPITFRSTLTLIHRHRVFTDSGMHGDEYGYRDGYGDADQIRLLPVITEISVDVDGDDKVL